MNNLISIDEEDNISQIWEIYRAELGYMRLIVLMGLVTVEKIELAFELAQHQVAAGRTVTIIDNVQRLAVDGARANKIETIRLDGDLHDQLHPVMAAVTSDIALLAVAETARPDDLFVLLNDLQDSLPDIEMTTLALIDTRTCDCFPQLRSVLEDYADVVVNLPIELDTVMRRL